MKTIVLLSCCKTKLPYKAPAEIFYQSAGFKKSLAYAKSLNPSEIYILSAKHHLVSLDKELEPYDVCLNDFSTDGRKVWAESVISQLNGVANLENDRFIILAGKNYYSEIVKTVKNFELPLAGLQMGYRLQWLDENTVKNKLAVAPVGNEYNSVALEIHRFFNELERFSYPFDETKIPENGIYVFFEKGEKYHVYDRIVRVGTHTGDGNLLSRINQHLANENKDRSIFRKNIGRAFLNMDKDPFLTQWNLDLTSRKNKEKYLPLLDREKLIEVESRVTKYMHENLSFAVIAIDKKEERLQYEAFLIRTLSAADDFKPSENWLGLNSSVLKIRESGFWLVNELAKK